MSFLRVQAVKNLGKSGKAGYFAVIPGKDLHSAGDVKKP